MAEFVFKIDGELVTIANWKDVPEKFDHIIRFIPEISNLFILCPSRFGVLGN